MSCACGCGCVQPCVYPDLPEDGSTIEEIEAYLMEQLTLPVTHGVFVLNGYTFTVDWPRTHEGPPTFWRIRAQSPPTARDTQRARPELGFQWTWNEVINTIKAEIRRVLSAVPTPDPGPWYP